MALTIMVQGTMSGAGKSLLVTALCRIFHRMGYRTAPFKSQNMALNSFVTPDGLELGRAQAAQAEAAGIDCDVRMNPILLKPESDSGSQVIVMGEVVGHMEAADYFRMKRSLIPVIREAFDSLAAENDIIVIEGAGSPAEINLRRDDIVNMGLAELVDAPVLLVGDIDRGGVFAQLYGTIALLREEERCRVLGTVINKFRGDVGLLEPGLRQLEALTGVPVLAVLPWMRLDLDDEDSLAPRLKASRAERPLQIAVVKLPHLSNFTDFSPLEDDPAIGLRYVAVPEETGRPDLLILPGTKSSLSDLKWLKETGFRETIGRLHGEGVPILGVCGGYQMLGQRLSDPEGTEGEPGEDEGLGLLPCETVFLSGKRRERVGATVCCAPFDGCRIEGYEIHMGETRRMGGSPFCRLDGGIDDGCAADGVFGTYVHGLFDSGALTEKLAEYLAGKRGLKLEHPQLRPRRAFREREYERLADSVEAALDIPLLIERMKAWESRRKREDRGT